MFEQSLILGRSWTDGLVEDESVDAVQGGGDRRRVGDGGGACVGQPSEDGVLGVVEGVLKDVEGGSAWNVEDKIGPEACSIEVNFLDKRADGSPILFAQEPWTACLISEGWCDSGRCLVVNDTVSVYGAWGVAAQEMLDKFSSKLT